MEQYEIARVDSVPDWKMIKSLEIKFFQWMEPVDIHMTAQICYSDDSIFVRLRAKEKDIRAELQEPVSNVCEDSCMELFFRPNEDELRYFNFEINPNGQTFIGLGTGKDDLVRLLPTDPRNLFDISTKQFEGGWEAVYAIPLGFIQLFFPSFRLIPGKVIFANCYKCGHKTNIPHYLAWNPLQPEITSFHSPSQFGRMVLQE